MTVARNSGYLDEIRCPDCGTQLRIPFDPWRARLEHEIAQLTFRLNDLEEEAGEHLVVVTRLLRVLETQWPDLNLTEIEALLQCTPDG